MGLNKLTNRIYFLEQDPEVDRPMLAYLKGDKISLAIDAGYSASHVQDFYRAIESEQFNKPDFTVITHWHYDHTFGMHAINGISIRFLYKGIIIKHNKTEPTYTKTSLFLCEKRRFFMARTEKGVVTTI